MTHIARQPSKFFSENEKWAILSILVFSFVFFITSLCTGGAYFSYSNLRSHYLLSDCTIIDIEEITYINEDCDCKYYGAKWTIEYNNSIADLSMNGTISERRSRKSEIIALISIKRVNTTHPCIFRDKDFELRWNLPFSNVREIGIASLVMLCISISILFVTLIYICIKKLLQRTKISNKTRQIVMTEILPGPSKIEQGAGY